MKDNQLYPTPDDVIGRMLSPYWRRGYLNPPGRSILEPSAGKGSILDYLSKRLGKNCRLYACEIDPDMRHVLQGKGYRVVGCDFMEYQASHYFDCIIMNPPFNMAAKHILKAWEVLRHGDLVALCNSETLDNPYSADRRQLQRLVQDHGSVEPLGKVFLRAERKTDVGVSLVRLTKEPKGGGLDFSKAGFEDGERTAPDFGGDFSAGVARKDVIENMRGRYVGMMAAFEQLAKGAQAIEYYAKGIMNYPFDKVVDILGKGKPVECSYNMFNDLTKLELWRVAMEKTKVEKYFTSKAKDNFKEFMAAQGAMEFSQANVEALVNMIFYNRDRLMAEAVSEAFDLLTKYHEGNRVYPEGWKSNNRWKAAPKVVIPNGVSYEEWRGFRTPWDPVYDDLDKVLAYLSGTPYQTVKTVKKALDDAFTVRKSGKLAGNLVESTFFWARFYKKGTVHLKFKDRLLLDLFNLTACAGKKWLPEGSGFSDGANFGARQNFTMLSKAIGPGGGF